MNWFRNQPSRWESYLATVVLSAIVAVFVIHLTIGAELRRFDALLDRLEGIKVSQNTNQQVNQVNVVDREEELRDKRLRDFAQQHFLEVSK